jgi:hypothetical protein
VIDDISHGGLQALLREEGVTFQRLKTWKTSTDPDYAVKKARVEHLYAIADGEVIPGPGEPEVIFCLDEFGPRNLQPCPGRQYLRAPLASMFAGQRLRGLTAKEGAEDLEAITRVIESGAVTPVIDRTYALADAPDAIRYLAGGHAAGKVVVTV